MFEWLKGIETYKYKENCYIRGYDKTTKKFILENEEGNETEQVNIFDLGITYNINQFDNWQEKLLNGLIKNDGKINIDILSTESGDCWNLDIYRHKTLLPTHEYSEQIVLINYAIAFAGEVKGQILAKQYKNYTGCGIDEEKYFTEWIEEQVEEVSEFNNTDVWSGLDAIACSNCLCTQEEYNILWDMFNEKNA